MIRSFIINQVISRLVALLVSWGVPMNVSDPSQGADYEYPSPYSEGPEE